jgi:hypothetical protein
LLPMMLRWLRINGYNINKTKTEINFHIIESNKGYKICWPKVSFVCSSCPSGPPPSTCILLLWNPKYLEISGSEPMT